MERQFQADGLQQLRAPRSAGDDEFIALEPVAATGYGAHPAVADFNHVDVDATLNLASHFHYPPPHGMHEFSGIEMAILWKIHCAGHIHRHRRIQPGGGRSIENLRFQADLTGGFGDFRFLFESLGGLAQHQQATLHQPETLFRSQLAEESAAFQIQIPQQLA